MGPFFELRPLRPRPGSASGGTKKIWSASQKSKGSMSDFEDSIVLASTSWAFYRVAQEMASNEILVDDKENSVSTLSKISYPMSFDKNDWYFEDNCVDFWW